MTLSTVDLLTILTSIAIAESAAEIAVLFILPGDRCTHEHQRLTIHQFPAGRQSYASMSERMRHTVFCPAFPGDSPSTRRLSEIFLAGCIPVFLGPPWHSMPFSETVRTLPVASALQLEAKT